MKLYEFLRLSDYKQYQTVWNLGKHAETKTVKDITYQLYVLDDFYVEIHYNATTNKIVGKIPFKEGEILEKYLPNISI
jgi:hypothetical protein